MWRRRAGKPGNDVGVEEGWMWVAVLSQPREADAAYVHNML